MSSSRGSLSCEMATIRVRQLDPTFKQGVLSARVSRMWHYRGGTDKVDIQHVGIVFIVQEGSAIYAEIGANDVEAKHCLLAEGEIYTFSGFRVRTRSPHTDLWTSNR